MLITKTKVGPWEFNTSNQPLHMTSEETRILEIYLRNWQPCFPESGNLSELHFGVKSALVRFDYVVEHGLVHVYELEERPAGIGVTCMLRPDFLLLLKKYLKEQEEALSARFALYISESRKNSSDDHIFSEISGFPIFEGYVDETTLSQCAWYVRAFRHEHDVDTRFNARSLSTIRHEGNKSYGVPLGLWTEFGAGWEPDWSQAFVVKPKKGSRFEQVLLWHPDSKELGAGFATRTKVTTAIREGKVSFRQPYHAPEEISVGNGRFRRIRRAYFVWSPAEKRYMSLGGMWMATPTARVHGTKDSVSGVLLAA